MFVQIDQYEQLHADIEKMDSEQVFSGWFRVDLRPFKRELLNSVNQWSNLIKNYLHDRVINRYLHIVRDLLLKVMYSYIKLNNINI